MSGVELHLPPDAQFVGLARLVVVTAARRAGMNEERVADLRIAVSEATTNAILHRQRADTGDPVVLCFETKEQDAFQVTIENAGNGYDPESPEVWVERDWQGENGLGITLIRNLADDVEYIPGHGTKVALRFAVSLSPGTVAAS